MNLWDVATGRLRHALAGRRKDAWSVAFSPDGKTLATGWTEGEVILFDVDTGWEVADLPVGTNGIRWLGFHPDGRSLGVVGKSWPEGQFGVWDLATRKEIRRMTVPAPGHLCGAWRPDGLLMASSGDVDGTVRLWSTDGKTDAHRIIQLYPSDTPWLHGLAMSPEGRHLATANPDGTLSVLRISDLPPPFDPGPARPVPDPKELASRPAAADALKREAIPPDLLKLVGGDPARVPPEVVAVFGDTRFRLPKAARNSWMAQDREEVPGRPERRRGRRLRRPDGRTSPHADRAQRPGVPPVFSPDGQFLAAGNFDGDHTIKVWDLKTGITATLKGHTDVIWAVAYTDGTRLVSRAAIRRRCGTRRRENSSERWRR